MGTLLLLNLILQVAMGQLNRRKYKKKIADIASNWKKNSIFAKIKQSDSESECN